MKNKNGSKLNCLHGIIKVNTKLKRTTWASKELEKGNYFGIQQTCFWFQLLPDFNCCRRRRRHIGQGLGDKVGLFTQFKTDVDQKHLE